MKTVVHFWQTLQWKFQALALRLLWSFFRMLSPEIASRIGRKILSSIGPKTKKHRRALANLRMAFPGASPDELRVIERNMWGNAGATIAEMAHQDKLTQPIDVNDYVELVFADASCKNRPASKPAIYVSAHLANWELCAYAVSQLVNTPMVIYNPQLNPYLDELVQAKRSNVPAEYVGKENAVRKLLTKIKKGGSAGLLVDLRLDDGPLIPFFGADATTTTMPAWISMKTGCDIIPIQIERIANLRYRATVHPALQAEVGDETAEEAVNRVTREINQRIEGWIHEHPGDWLCSMRRWPKETLIERGVWGR